MAIATERWQERTFQRAQSAHRAWDVIRASNERDAVAACGLIVNQRHPYDARLRVKNDGIIARTNGGPTTWMVEAEYGFPETGAYEINTDPLQYETEYEWTVGLSTEPMDRDVYENPIISVNSDPISPPPTAEVRNLFLDVSRYEKTFDLVKSLKFSNSLNINKFKIAAYGIVNPGEMKCISYLPATKIKNSAEYIKVNYKFEVRSRIVAGRPDFALFWTREECKGNTGFYQSSTGPKRGFFCDTTGSVLTNDVPLDSFAVPLDKNIRVKDDADRPQIAIRNPDASTIFDFYGQDLTKPQVRLLKDKAGKPHYFIYYQNSPTNDFTKLGIF